MTTKIGRFLVAAAIGATSLGAVSTAQSEPAKKNFRVLGTWSTGIGYEAYELPLWSKDIPDASGGRLTADVQSLTELGLSGTEVLKLASTGAFDAVFGLYSYVVSGDPVFESLDIPFVASTLDEQEKIVDALAPTVAEEMERIHGIKILANYPFPMPVLACRDPLNNLGDLKGRKVRVLSAAHGDLVKGLGGIPLNIPFAEVPTSLQRGVVDCGMASAVAVYLSKWFDVTNHVYEKPISPALGFLAMSMSEWNSLDADTQKIISEQAAAFGKKTWDAMTTDEQQGIACLTGLTNGGPDCSFGPAASMTLVPESPDDAALRQQALASDILPGFKARCGDDCFESWQKTVNAALGK